MKELFSFHGEGKLFFGNAKASVAINNKNKGGGGGGSMCVSRPVTSVGKYGAGRGPFPLTPFNIPFIY